MNPEGPAQDVIRLLQELFQGSLDAAKTWLAGEMNTWRKITSEVKIETE